MGLNDSYYNSHICNCNPFTFFSEGKGFLYNVFCSGGINEKDPWNEKDNRENVFMAFFRDFVAQALNKGSVKVVVLILFAGYLAVSGWAVASIEEGLNRRHLARFDSYSVEFYDAEDKYFKEYPFRINVIINSHLDYSNLTVQREIESMMKELENNTFIDPFYSESWLRDFLNYVEKSEEFQKIDISTEEKFVTALNEVFIILLAVFRMIRSHVAFDCRFISVPVQLTPKTFT